MHELRLFLVAISRHWMALMSGLLSILVWAASVSFYPAASASIWIFGTLAILSFFLACFLAWRDTYWRLLAETASRDANPRITQDITADCYRATNFKQAAIVRDRMIACLLQQGRPGDAAELRQLFERSMVCTPEFDAGQVADRRRMEALSEIAMRFRMSTNSTL